MNSFNANVVQFIAFACDFVLFNYFEYFQLVK